MRYYCVCKPNHFIRIDTLFTFLFILTWMTNKTPLYHLKVGVWLTRWFDACYLVIKPYCCLHSCFYIFFTWLVTISSLKHNINIYFLCRFTSDLMGWRNPDAMVKMLLLQDLTGSAFLFLYTLWKKSPVLFSLQLWILDRNSVSVETI